jgi:hypothetical protein
MVVGSVNCALRTLFTKLAKLQAKNSFSIAIILGDLFGPASTEADLEEIVDLLEGTITVPLPTYFTLGNSDLPRRIVEKLEAEDEVCPNLFFLGRRGTIKTSEGIRIVALGGQHGNTGKSGNAVATTKYSPVYTDSDARSLNGAHHADILVTNQWPQAVQTGSKIQVPNTLEAFQGVRCVADLCSVLKPRYHFSSSPDLFYEREPFFHAPAEENTTAKLFTRFISLASLNNESKQKWLYAFSLETAVKPTAVPPPGTTPSPFTTLPNKRPAPSDQLHSYSRFSNSDDFHQRGKRQRQPPPAPAECFFCLSNLNLATHLITSIGDDAYLTTAKGPLTTSKTFPSLPFPGHILIIPLSHSPTLASIPEAATRASTFKEMQRYRDALQQMVQQRAKEQLGGVTWEVSRASGIHVHWQFLPVPADMIRTGLVEAAFKVEAENEHYPKMEQRDIGAGTEETNDYFRVWIWSPPAPSDIASQGGRVEKVFEKSLVLPLSPRFRFDLQFGRKVLAKLLQLDSRANWKEATQVQSEEEADVTGFKEAFKNFDFSLIEA